MNPQPRFIFASAPAGPLALFVALLLAISSLALFPGCKDKSSSAALVEKHVSPPPTLTILPTASDPRNANPFTDPLWTAAPWYAFVAPSNTTRSTSPVRAAILYDAQNLFVAFVSDTVPPPTAPVSLDTVSIYLDTTSAGLGNEVAHIAISSKGRIACDWIRTESPAQPKPDGSPDWYHTYRQIPNLAIPGLSAKTYDAVQSGSPVWAAVIAIPLASLPSTLRQSPAPGATWKINLLRSITTTDVGSGTEQLQSNLSQVYLGAQPVSPYRMAKLTLAPAPKP